MGIGTLNPDHSAALDIMSTSKGVLVPRLTTAQRIAILTPANGLLVYDTDVACFFYFDIKVWKNLCNGGLAGATGSVGATGSTGAQGIQGNTGASGIGGIDWTKTVWVNNAAYTVPAGVEIVHFYGLTANRNLVLGTCDASTNANRQIISVNHGGRDATTSAAPGTFTISLTTGNTARFPGLNSWGPSTSGDYNVKTFVCMPVNGTWFWTWR